MERNIRAALGELVSSKVTIDAAKDNHRTYVPRFYRRRNGNRDETADRVILFIMPC